MRRIAAHLRAAVARHLEVQRMEEARHPTAHGTERAWQAQMPPAARQDAGAWEKAPTAAPAAWEEAATGEQGHAKAHEELSDLEQMPWDAEVPDRHGAAEAAVGMDMAGERRRAALLRPYTEREVSRWSM